MYSEIRSRMIKHMPNTHNAMTWLVPAMENAYRSIGKKSLFGKDKFVPAYQEVVDNLRKTLLAMDQDQLIGYGISQKEINNEFIKVVMLFSEAYPNWQDGYIFFKSAFVDAKNDNLQNLIKSYISVRENSSNDRIENFVKQFNNGKGMF